MPPVEIQWCDHSSVLLEYLRQLYEEGRFVDVGLECEGRQVKAHKAVISACSPYLEGLLKGNPARSHLIKFNGYSYNSLRAVIDFMYNGKVMVEQDQLAAFLKLGRALQVRGILDIAAQCEEAGLTTPEETKSNAQYSTTVQPTQKTTPQVTRPAQQQATPETKKFAFMMEKGGATSTPAGVRKVPAPQYRKVQTEQKMVTPTARAQQQARQQAQQKAAQQAQQEQQAVEDQHNDEVTATTLDELQQALASGQAILQTTDANGTEQTLQMVEGQCVVTGSGQTYVVVQEGDNISFVPAEMVQGDLETVNGAQVVEGLDQVEQQLAEMEGQVLDEQAAEGVHDESGGGGDAGALETMSVVESLVKLSEKQPEEDHGTGTEHDSTEVGADMPNFEGETSEEGEGTGAAEDGNKRRRQPTQKMIEAMGMLKRKADTASPAGRGKKSKN